MADEKQKEKRAPTKSERCGVVLNLLEKRRDVVEEAYIASLEAALAGHDNVSQDAISLLDTIQEIDEHIAEMKKQSSEKKK